MRRDTRLLLTTLLFGALLTSCSSSARPGQPSAASFERPGPYVAGVATLSLPYTTVELWYPAAPASARGRAKASYDIRDWLPPSLADRVPPDVFSFQTDAYRDVPAAAGGPFPLVLFAHGLNSFRDQSTFLTTWLASWGFIVAAPEFPAHDLTEYFTYLGRPPPAAPPDTQVLADAEDLVVRLDHEPGSLIAGDVAPRPMAVVGHSQGGIDAMAFASRPEVAVYIPLAAGFVGAHPAFPAKPSLWMVGSEDHDIRPPWVKRLYESASTPKRLVVLSAAGHLAFTDLCLVGTGHGGLLALGADLGIRLPFGSPFTPAADDGCGAFNLSPLAGYAVIRADVVSELRTVLG